MRLLAVCVCGLSVLATWSSPVSAQEKKADPSGTWRWELELDDNVIKNVLKLDADKDGKLTGTLEAMEQTLKVEDGKVDGDKVSFTVTVQMEQKVKVSFNGKQAGDALKGDISAKTDDGNHDFVWDAKRSVDAADVVGAWDLKIETSDGNTLKPTVTISQSGDALAGSYEHEGKKLEAKELKVKDNHLTFEIDTELQGSQLHVEFRGRPYGSKLKGTLEYSINGDSGELDFTGMRKSTK